LFLNSILSIFYFNKTHFFYKKPDIP